MSKTPQSIRWGILGTGTVSRDFAEGLRHVPGAQLVAVGSRTAARAKAFAGRFAVPRWYEGYDTLIEDRDIDVVYVATPNANHNEHSLISLQAGKAVLCEKPFTLDAIEAREVIELARRKALFCMEAMWMRFLPIMSRLRELIESRAIGEVRMLTADLGTRAQYDPHNRFFSPRMGGGALLDQGIYPLSLAFFLLGPPDGITSAASIGPSGVDEESVAVLSYAQSTLAVISASLRAHLPGEATVIGTGGQIRVHAPLYRPHRLTIRQFSQSVDAAKSSPPRRGLRAFLKNSPALRALYFQGERLLAPFVQSRGTHIIAPFTGNGYNYEAAEVMRCLRAGHTESSVMPLDETLRIMECVDTIRGKWRAQ